VAQFDELSQLCARLKGTNFTLICCPCSQFLNQEVADDSDVLNFTLGKLQASGGSFVVLERMDVNGPNTHPMYHFLKRYSSLYRPKRGKAFPIPWNYGKFLVDAKGSILEFGSPASSPLAMETKIRESLGA